MKMLLESDFTNFKFKEEKLFLQEAILKGNYSFKSLLQLMLHPDYKDKASWVMSGVVENNPSIVNEEEMGFLLDLLEKKPTKGVERNIWRAFEFIEIPKGHQEQCVHLAFETLEDKKSSIAVQVFAMSSAFKLSKKSKDLKRLLKEILLLKIENASKGFQSRARKILKELN
ncbi:hypothetical protein SAMN05661096_01937 [Marivirga sericea]|uniref:HEAT repeat-containing protein n=1 Tax=Marivirga sericea TaxID=1028 RepID=A0A1X7JQ62_9BACT|nr:hypothetical protein [Marivirga sericea]SMG30104.1 hypothetical protein SAMN05661096_01937 [Marivirga sericea]